MNSSIAQMSFRFVEVIGETKRKVFYVVLLSVAILLVLVWSTFPWSPKPESKAVAGPVEERVGYVMLTYDKLMTTCPAMINGDFDQKNKDALKSYYAGSGINTADNPAAQALWRMCLQKKSLVSP